MNNKIFFKIAWLFITTFLVYLFFLVFFLAFYVEFMINFNFCIIMVLVKKMNNFEIMVVFDKMLDDTREIMINTKSVNL